MLSFTKDEFTFVDMIGKGSFGQVYKWFIFISFLFIFIFSLHKKTGIIVAIKTIDLEKAEDDIDDIQREISILGQCDCQNITKYYSSKIVVFILLFLKFIKSTQLWIVMEYLGGGSAYDLVDFFIIL